MTQLEFDILENKVEVLEDQLKLLDEFVGFISDTLVEHFNRHDRAAEVINEYNAKLKKLHDPES